MKLRWLIIFVLLSGCATPKATKDPLIAKAEQGDAAAQFRLGIAYDNGGRLPKDLKKAAEWYRKSADKGYAPAQNSLGSMYQRGEGVAKNEVEAVRWYRLAADREFAEAYANLGYMYDLGLGVAQDRQMAVALYRRAADGGSVLGMLNLSVSYWQSQGANRDLVQAYWWADKARYFTKMSSDAKLKARIQYVLDEVAKQMTPEEIAAAVKLGASAPAR